MISEQPLPDRRTTGLISPPLDRADRAPVLEGGLSYEDVNAAISKPVLQRGVGCGWLLGFAMAFGLLMVLLGAVTWLFIRGVGIWGINIPVGWGFAIINFVWWIGIGHAGTLISAILLLLRQQWRTSINRFAEAMTLFAVSCALLFPILHLGRPQFFFWLAPYPNTMGLWPQFRSPLIWDFFAITTYGLVSLLFWYVGLIPDFATLRDRAKNRFVKIVFGITSFGWRGSARHWKRYQDLYFLLAALATPLVVSVHSVVSFDFAVSQLPGWHSTIFPPYFVAGAIYAGFAMVLMIAIPLRKAYHFEAFITDRHLRNMGIVMLASGLVVAYGYLMEAFMSFYSANEYESFMMNNRILGPYGPLFWLMIACNVLIPQLLWVKRIRTSWLGLWLISLVVSIGMWLERFVIIVTSLHRDFLPSSWAMYTPTIWDIATFVGTIGLFLTLLFLFIRFVPVISMTEVKELLTQRQGRAAE
jgi:Ni/Fe-hydrogenase subunit HybB-like protein